MALGDTDTFTADSPSDAPDYASDRSPTPDTSTQSPAPSRAAAITISQPQSQPRRNEFDQPTLDRAYHTIDFLQRNPQWLANPYTMHAANAILAGSSKMIEMSIQLDRVNAMADSAKLKLNTDTRLIQHLNDGMAKLKDLATVAAIREEIQANGPSPRAISMLNTQLEAENPAGKPDSLTMSDGTVLQGFRDRFGNFHQSALQVNKARSDQVESHINLRYENAKGLAGIKFQNSKELMKDKDFWNNLTFQQKELIKPYDKRYEDAVAYVRKLKESGVTEGGKMEDGSPDLRLTDAKRDVLLIAAERSGILKALMPNNPNRSNPEPASGDTPDATHASSPASAAETQQGQIYKGYKFLGGDWKDKSNWQPVQQ